MKFIFVHIPKTAGTSFRKALEEHFGAERVLYDYGEDSSVTSDVVLQNMYRSGGDAATALSDWDVIAGHFTADKYRAVFPEAALLTFIRHPVARMLSEYNHVRKKYGFSGTLGDFYRNPRHQNKIDVFFGGLLQSDFAFIGLSEAYESSLLRFFGLTGIALPQLRLNVLQAKDPLLRISYREGLVMEEANSRDMGLYRDVARNLAGVSSEVHVCGHVTTVATPSSVEVVGWAFDTTSDLPCTVCFTDGERRHEVRANLPRPDVARLGYTTSKDCGFRVEMKELLQVLEGDLVQVLFKDTGDALAGSPIRVR